MVVDEVVVVVVVVGTKNVVDETVGAAVEASQLYAQSVELHNIEQ